MLVKGLSVSRLNVAHGIVGRNVLHQDVLTSVECEFKTDLTVMGT